MPTEPTDWIAAAERVGVELKSLIREAHQAARDLKVETKLAKTELERASHVLAQQGKTLDRNLKEIGDSLQLDFDRHSEVIASIGVKIGEVIGVDLVQGLRDVMNEEAERWELEWREAGETHMARWNELHDLGRTADDDR